MPLRSAPFVLLLVPILLAAGRIAEWVPVTESTQTSALDALMGEWQSDTVGGTSARSFCAWTAHHSALVCEQIVTAASGTTNALNVFTAKSASDQFVLYSMQHPGEVMSPVPMTIRGAQWFYGGTTPNRDGRYYRTVNDFSRADMYTWRQEMSQDGKRWTAGIHGQSRRVRPTG